VKTHNITPASQHEGHQRKIVSADVFVFAAVVAVVDPYPELIGPCPAPLVSGNPVREADHQYAI